MTRTALEERMNELEARLDALQKQFNERQSQLVSEKKQGWQAIVGTFANDPLYDEAMRLGREWRESQREASTEATN